jgi:hypothetical protein
MKTYLKTFQAHSSASLTKVFNRAQSIAKRWHANRNRRTAAVCLALLGAICLAGWYGFSRRPASPTVQASAPSKFADLNGAAAVNHLRQQGLYDSLNATVKAARRKVRPVAANSSFEAENPEQQLRAHFTANGARLSSPASATPSAAWQLGLRLRGYGYGKQMLATTPGAVQGVGQRVELRHHLWNDKQSVTLSNAPSTITEWYENKAEGIEHGFTLNEPPLAGFTRQPLRVTLEMNGDLAASLDEDAQGLTLRGPGGATLRYDHLAVYDALGRLLAARMELSGSELTFVVEDGAAVYPLTIDPVFGQQQKLTSTGSLPPQDTEEFGAAVAISGNTAMVGILTKQIFLNCHVHFYVWNGSSWIEQDAITLDYPSSEIPMALSGDTSLIGNPHSGYMPQMGGASVYVRNGTSWYYQQRLEAADPNSYDEFGHSVAIYGNTALIGAWRDDVNGNVDQGSAYVFVRNGTTWTQQQRLTVASGNAEDLFGQAVALGSNTALIGAHNNNYGTHANQGTAYVFVRNGTTWALQQLLVADDGDTNDEFGYAVALSGNTALIGARFDSVGGWNNRGSAYVFTRSGTSWTMQQKLTAADGVMNDHFGFAVALSGNTALIGAYNDDVGTNTDQGSAYVFTRNGTTWTQTKQLLAADGAAGDNFGRSVALDGETALIAAPKDVHVDNNIEGSAYVFFCPTIAFTPATLPDGRVGISYSQSLTASGGTAPHNFTLVGGTMPPGLTLSSTGLLSGTPTTSGSFYLYVQATDANGCSGIMSYPLTIKPPCTTITINPATVPNGARNQAYYQQLTASGGVSPYSFTYIGSLPSGMTLSTSGQLVGTPTVTGSFNFKAKATDANGCSGQRTYTLTITAF